MIILRKRSLTVVVVVSVITLLTGFVFADNNLEKLAKGVMLSPPPGPFFKGASSISGKKDALVPPTAPIKPVRNSGITELKINSLEFKVLPPKLKKAEVKEPELIGLPAKKLIAPVMQKSVPTFFQKQAKPLKTHQVAKNNSKELALNSSQGAPIWMQQGSFVNQGSKAVTDSKSQNNKINMQYQNYSGMQNMGWSYPMPQYMYVPVQMMAPSTVPQMPLAPSFNYGTPMSFYNNIPLSNNSLMKDGIVMPAQKDNN